MIQWHPVVEDLLGPVWVAKGTYTCGRLQPVVEDLRVQAVLGPTKSVLGFISSLGLISSKKRTTLRRRGKSSGEKID